MLRAEYPLYLAGKPVSTPEDGWLDVSSKYTGQTVSRVAKAGSKTVAQAIDAAHVAMPAMRRMSSAARRAVLEHLVEQARSRHEELSHALAIEAGKPICYARLEVDRLLDTLRISAEEATRVGGEYVPLDISPRTEAYEGVWRRVPVGPCAFITPFNFPMNLVAHKIGPAIAAGNPWILKPASATPIGALLLGEMLADCDLPPGAFSILPADTGSVAALIEDERIRLLSFTGSPEVGWGLKARAGRKKVALELGGNAACIVDAGVNLADAADRITFGAFYQSGQSCISVQRVLAHADVYGELRDMLVERAMKLKAGDPLDDETFLGPLISEDAARRVEAWVDEIRTSAASEAAAGNARKRGAGAATILCGGRRDGAFYEATWIEAAPPAARVSCDEVFGPVATLQPFEDFERALESANDSRYGLQCGVFTPNLHHAMRAWRELEVGAVVINDVPSFRVDHMPYGGVKDSGLGREGVRFAIEEMTEIRLMVLRNPPRR